MKKVVALVLCLVMVVGLMAGCEKAMDVKTLTQKMDEAAKNQTAASGKFAMDLKMTMAMPGMTMDMGIKADGEMKGDLSKGAIYVDMDASMEALGQSEEMGMKIYANVAEDGSSTMYMYEASSDSWIKTVQEGYAEQLNELQNSAIVYADVPVEKMTLAEEKQTVNGVECYVLTMELDGTYFTDEMKAMMGTAAESMDEASKAMMESMDWSALNAKAVYYVDAKTFNTVQMDMEILGLGEMMKEIMDASMAALGDLMGDEQIEITVDVPVFKVGMSEMSYTNVEVPAVPQEAIDNAIDADEMTADDEYFEETELGNPPQADGSYLLTLGETSIRVIVPAAYTVYLSEEYSLNAMTENMDVMVSYMPFADYTTAEMMLDYEAQVAASKEENRWLSNEVIEDVNGFTVTKLIYNDGVYEVVACKDITGGVMVVSVASFELVPEVDEILNNIQIG